MSTLGYGMYGYNVLNVNGETDSLPVCRLSGVTATESVADPFFFANAQDEYGMAIPNQNALAGTYSGIRTIVSGIHEISFRMDYQNTAAVSLVRTLVICDRSINFDSASGLPIPGGGTNAYTIDVPQIPTPANATGSTTQNWSITLFLEKDCYITMYNSVVFGTVSLRSVNTGANMTVKCISAENFAKIPSQT